MTKYDREPRTPEDERVKSVMDEISKLIDARLQGDYGGVIVFLRVGGPQGDPPHEFYIQSPMTNEMVIWTLESAAEEARKASAH